MRNRLAALLLAALVGMLGAACEDAEDDVEGGAGEVEEELNEGEGE